MRSLLVAVALCTLAACDDSLNSLAPVALPGTWYLRSINSQPLPVLIFRNDTETIEVMSDILNIQSNGRFTQTTSLRRILDGEVSTLTETDSGVVMVNGNAATFTFVSDGSTGIGTRSGNLLTVLAQGREFIYARSE